MNSSKVKRVVVVLGMCCLLVGMIASASQTSDLSAYTEANIDWTQASGQKLRVVMITASYYLAVQQLTPIFEQLTGLDVEYSWIPPAQMREKTVLDLAAKSNLFSTHPMDIGFAPMYGKNEYVEPLGKYLNDPQLTDKEWFNVDGIWQDWLGGNSWGGELLAIPFAGETTITFYRTDLYEKYGLTGPPETLDDFMEYTKKLNNPPFHYGAALVGFRGTGQSMYTWSSLFREFGAEWLDENMKPQVNSPEAVKALEYYVTLLQDYAPPGVVDWNWDSIVTAFQQTILAQFIHATTLAPMVENPAKSLVTGKIGYARWPKGPAGRVGSMFTWGFCVPKSLPEEEKIATWLFVQWVTSQETQERMSRLTWGDYATPQHSGVNRPAISSSPEFREAFNFGNGQWADVFATALENDLDPDWRPRIPEYREFLDLVSIAVQQALIGQTTPQKALDWAQMEVEKVMKKAGYYN